MSDDHLASSHVEADSPAVEAPRDPTSAYAPPAIVALGAVNTETLQTGIP
jgi:hypothetical protein